MYKNTSSKSNVINMFWSRKSYTDGDVLRIAMLIRQIDQAAEDAAPPIAEGLIKWAKKDPSNKRKVNRAMGIIRGIVTGKYDGEPSDFNRFFKSVTIKAFNYGVGSNFGHMMYKDHMRLYNKMDKDYFLGITEGKLQASTGEDLYLKHRLTW